MVPICPNCEKETKIETLKRQETISVRGEDIHVEGMYHRCEACGSEFENTRGSDVLDAAYRKYRDHHKMLQPEAIRDWRKSLGLTQKELSVLLGWGGATLSRYENGALQDEAHEKIMRLVMEPHNFVKLLRETPDSMDDEKRSRLIADMSAVEAEAWSLDRILEEPFASYNPDLFTGYRKFDLNKMFNVIMFFCVDGQLETKLNKLLFYADFKHFKEYTVGITGMRYVHLKYGPVPDNYELFFLDLVRKNKLAKDEVVRGKYSGKEYRSTTAPDLGLFTESELGVLKKVKNYFAEFTAFKIKNFSHQERGYSETRESEPISYGYAEFLKI